MNKMGIFEHLTLLSGWISVSPTTLNLVLSELHVTSEGEGAEQQEKLISNLSAELTFSEQFVDCSQHSNRGQ